MYTEPNGTNCLSCGRSVHGQVAVMYRYESYPLYKYIYRCADCFEKQPTHSIRFTDEEGINLTFDLFKGPSYYHRII